MVIATQEELDHLSMRIQVAYKRRGIRWEDGCSTSRVWTAAAMTLWQCRLDDPDVPVDPELFVASQPISRHAADPWADLACERAAQQYRKRIRRIVRQLKTELDREIRLVERMIREGRSLDAVVLDRNSRLSPMSRYIVAQRADRPDLVERWSGDALDQHDCCPLYRNAARGYLAADEYPADRSPVRTTLPVPPPTYSPASSRN
ncbi:hypothetical protein [Planctomyces sp. SH-PL62]|uniref:hypothetical protein n=1 Tax=Planctomyces sp. SH-PL62 TaxID=1636152 RepID=UPI0012E71E1E|nr:hypothetical protein [Planctomyces sp. SH-PL62]